MTCKKGRTNDKHWTAVSLGVCLRRPITCDTVNTFKTGVSNVGFGQMFVQNVKYFGKGIHFL